MARPLPLLSLPLLATLLLPAQPLAAVRLMAQAPIALPDSIPAGATVRIDGDPSLAPTNAVLVEQFAARYPDTQVSAASSTSEAAVQALQRGDIDIAALGRPLSAQEAAAGLTAVSLPREKIAIIIGRDNPFQGNLTFEQFAQIFRGEITNWAEVGGPPGPIRFVDRPATSDTRQAFQSYPVFQAAPFEAGATADPVSTDDTQAVIEALGSDGISYAIAPQVLDSDAVTVVPMHQTLPDDPRYPFSQPRYYVYSGDPTPAVAAFLVAAADPAAIAASTADGSPAGSPADSSNDGPDGAAGTTADGAAGNGSPGDGVTADGAAGNGAPAGDAAADGTLPAASVNRMPLWGWLVPLGLLGLFLWLLLGRRRRDTPPTPSLDLPHGTPLPEPERSRTATVDDIAPVAVTDPELTHRAQSVVEADRDQPLTLGNTASSAIAAGLAAGATARQRQNSSPPVAPVSSEPVSPAAVPQIPTAADVASTPPAAAKLHGEESEEDTAWAGDAASPSSEATGQIVPEPLDDLVEEVFSAAVVKDAIAADGLATAAPDPPRPDPLAAPAPETAAQAAAGIPETPNPETPNSATYDRSAGPMPALDSTLAAAGLAAAGLAAGRLTSRTATNSEPKPGGRSNLSPRSDAQAIAPPDKAALATVDEGLLELPDGYGESRIVLMPRDPKWAYAYWDIPNEHRAAVRHQGGQDLALRLYDVTDVDLNTQAPHTLQQYGCDEMARTWYLPVPVSDRDYILEIGYLTPSGDWLLLARSAPVHVPPVFPSDWIDDRFMTVDWSQNLRGQTLATLNQNRFAPAVEASDTALADAVFAQAQSTDALRVAGSLFGSMQQVPASAISSYAFPSGLTELPNMPLPDMPLPNMSGLNVSGLNMSGVGFAAEIPQPRKFWLVADAELIVYGATEPDATVTVGNEAIQLSSDGTFRFRMSFQDGELDFPIHATASDGEQTREVELNFERQTPERDTNPKDEAKLDWFE